MTSHDCGCSHAREQLVDYLRRELCEQEQAEVGHHLDDCPECTDEATVERVISDVVKRCCADAQAPGELRVRVVALLQRHCGGSLPAGVSRAGSEPGAH